MKSTGIVRKIDALGRIVIPKETRLILGIEENDKLEIFTDGDSLIFRKFEPACTFCGSEKDTVVYEEKIICRRCLEKLSKL